ncbi:TPA: glycosyltransferase [Streptococcus suis]
MKILFVTSSLTGGGAERVLSVLANEFFEMSEIDGVSVVSIIEDNVTYKLNSGVHYIPYHAKSNNRFLRIVDRYLFLRKAIINEKPDIIISFATQVNIYSILANLGLKSKVVISERNDPQRDPIQATVRKLRNQVYKLSDGAVFQTMDAMEYFANIKKLNKTVILNPLKGGLPLPFKGERENRIVTVARLHPAKNLPLLIDAFEEISKKLPQFVLEIFGEGNEKDYLTDLVTDKKIEDRVFFKGFSNKVHDEIRTATCFVLPSNYEGMSNAMLESLALGIPTICTDCPIGGARMVIDHMENGILTPVGNKEQLIRNIELLIEDSQLREKFEKNSIKIKEELSAKKIAKQWLIFINSIMADNV